MITKLSHSTLYVKNQEKALEFYRDKLGFKVIMDVTMDNGFRWITVQPQDQKDIEIVLMEPKEGPMFDAEAAKAIDTLLTRGLMGAGVFDTNDCQATYDELKKRGVEFVQPPAERFYGTEAIFKDDCGNWFSLTQRKE
jgi:catechol 2,3-dioxygenase-like lactoylglutathione lyase family enzyme